MGDRTRPFCSAADIQGRGHAATWNRKADLSVTPSLGWLHPMRVWASRGGCSRVLRSLPGVTDLHLATTGDLAGETTKPGAAPMLDHALLLITARILLVVLAMQVTQGR